MRAKLLNITHKIIQGFLLLIVSQASAQAIIINAPEPADNPHLGGNSPWTAICAGQGGFNEYFVNVTWAGTANPTNEFILELSDATGSFASAIELGRVNDKNTNTDFDMQFAIPTDTRGQGYKMRVRSTNPAKTGDESSAYSMYYMDVTNNLNISQLGDGVPPGSICATGAFTLQVDNIANPETYQYFWYRSGTELTGEKGHTLNVTQSGMYSAFIDYGPICTGSGNTDSNIVDVTVGSSGSGISITPPTKTALCAGDTETLTINTTDPSWSYKWYKNDVVIPGEIASSYTVDASNPGFEGDYQVEISGNSICTEKSVAVNITNADSFTVTRENADNIVLLPTQSKTLSVSTTANAPTYEWYRNGTIISGATNSTYDATQEGTYHVAVRQSGGTCPGTIKNSETTVVVAPASFEIIADYATAYTACANTSIVIEVKTINAVLSDNSKIDVTTDVSSSFTYQWEKDGAAVPSETGNSISLTNLTENGDYTITGTLNTYNTTSNALPVQLLTNETLNITSTGTVYCSSADVITLNTTTDLTGQTFAWQRDGSDINTADTSLIATTSGTYRLVVNRNGCDLISNEITISPLDEDLIALDVDGDVIFPEGSSKTVTATGGTTYQWFDAENNLVGSSSSMTFTEDGSYILIATVDNCEITKTITAIYLDLFNVPNVITPNGDGANDQWVIPNSYSNKQDVSVIIYNDKGVEVLNVNEYQNNWPSSTTSFPKQNMVFYYIIRNTAEILKQGTVTVIR